MATARCWICGQPTVPDERVREYGDFAHCVDCDDAVTRRDEADDDTAGVSFAERYEREWKASQKVRR